MQNFSENIFSKNDKKPYFPLFIDLSEKKILIVGGGAVATRRVSTLFHFANDITVIAPEVTDEIQKAALAGKVKWIKERFSYGFDGITKARTSSETRKSAKSILAEEAWKSADFVLAATDDADCNEEIARLCKKRGVPVNAAHKKELCDFYFPAVVVEDNVVAGITASGQSHSQARKTREKIEKALSE